ncbi:MAG TPA: hypothetical protein DCP11_03820, partial [Microbacteriaceae bacterium]|nr:hypothetical protein [Microbacteriaceae bacterium]
LAGAAIGAWVATVAIAGWMALSGRRRESLAVVAVVTLAACALLLTVAAVQSPQRQPPELLAAAHAGRFVTATAVTTEALHSGMGPFSVTLT